MDRLVRASQSRLTFWWVAVLVFAFIAIYALFPSESSQERFTLVVRLGAMGILSLSAVLLFPISRTGWVSLPIILFLVVSSVAISNFPIYPTRLLNVVGALVLSGLFVLALESGGARRFFGYVIDVLLVLSALAVFIQITIYLVSGSIVEVHQLLFPWGESRSSTLERFGIARVSGLHTEPGTHSAYTVGLLILRALIERRLYDKIGWVAIFSVLCTLSVWGGVASLLYIFSYVLRWAVTGARVLMVLSAAALIAESLTSVIYIFDSGLFGPVGEYFRTRSELQDSSGGAKVTAWDYGLRILPTVLFYGMSFSSDYCNGCQSPQDAGLILNLAIYFGLTVMVALAAFYIVAVLRTAGIRELPFFLLFFIAKFFYYDPIVWIVFFLSAVIVLKNWVSGGEGGCGG